MSHPDRASKAPLPAEPGRQRVILIGASNLTKGIGTVLATCRRHWRQPLEVFTALGHGRSYGRASRVLGRTLPGILEAAMWADLDFAVRHRAKPMATAALVTDIGNDVLYEEPVEQIAAWVEECIARLSAYEARTIVTLLPVENLETLSSARFHLMRRIFFPFGRISLAEVSRRAHALNDHLLRVANAHGAVVVRHRANWYGFDPIHIRHARRPDAWREILAPWSSDASHEPARGSLASTLYLRSRLPKTRRFLGFQHGASQPAARLRDGTTVSIY